MEKDFKDQTLAESNVSLKLSEIQQRCADLLDEPDGLELSLEEPAEKPDSGGNPYDRG